MSKQYAVMIDGDEVAVLSRPTLAGAFLRAVVSVAVAALLVWLLVHLGPSGPFQVWIQLFGPINWADTVRVIAAVLGWSAAIGVVVVSLFHVLILVLGLTLRGWERARDVPVDVAAASVVDVPDRDIAGPDLRALRIVPPAQARELAAVEKKTAQRRRTTRREDADRRREAADRREREIQEEKDRVRDQEARQRQDLIERWAAAARSTRKR